MMKEKGQFKKKFVQKIATIMMAAAMVVSGGFGVAPAADHSVSVYATDCCKRHENCNKDCRNYNKGILQKDLNNNCKKTGNCNDNNDQLSEKR